MNKSVMVVWLLSALSVWAQTLQIGGDPLTIQCDEVGTIGVLRTEEGTPVPQYYSTRAKGSVLFLGGQEVISRWGNGTSTFALWDDVDMDRFTPISHGVAGNSIQTELAAGESGVRVLQTLTYVPGEFEYELQWEVFNANEEEMFRNVRFLHGGDASLGGADFAVGEWQAASNQVVIRTNALSEDFMALRSPQAIAHHEDHFQLVREACKAGQLPSTVKTDPHDAAYALQWSQSLLGPGETWTLAAVESWPGQAVGPPVFADATALVLHPLFESWQLNRQTGTYFGVLRLQLAPESLPLAGPIWLVIDNNDDRRFMQPTGTTPAGKQYLDLSAQVAASVGETLDPGETAWIPDIEVYMRYRADPTDDLFSLWASTAGEIPVE